MRQLVFSNCVSVKLLIKRTKFYPNFCFHNFSFSAPNIACQNMSIYEFRLVQLNAHKFVSTCAFACSFFIDREKKSLNSIFKFGGSKFEWAIFYFLFDGLRMTFNSKTCVAFIYCWLHTEQLFWVGTIQIIFVCAAAWHGSLHSFWQQLILAFDSLNLCRFEQCSRIGRWRLVAGQQSKIIGRHIGNINSGWFKCFLWRSTISAGIWRMRWW